MKHLDSYMCLSTIGTYSLEVNHRLILCYARYAKCMPQPKGYEVLDDGSPTSANLENDYEFISEEY